MKKYKPRSSSVTPRKGNTSQMGLPHTMGQAGGYLKGIRTEMPKGDLARFGKVPTKASSKKIG